MIVLRVGLVRRRELFIYGFASPSKPVAVGTGSVALVLRGLVIVASAMPREFGVRELRISQVTYSLRVGLGGSSAGTTTSFGHLRTPSH